MREHKELTLDTVAMIFRGNTSWYPTPISRFHGVMPGLKTQYTRSAKVLSGPITVAIQGSLQLAIHHRPGLLKQCHSARRHKAHDEAWMIQDPNYEVLARRCAGRLSIRSHAIPPPLLATGLWRRRPQTLPRIHHAVCGTGVYQQGVCLHGTQQYSLSDKSHTQGEKGKYS